MSRAKLAIGTLTLLAIAHAAHAQPAEPRRILGTGISGRIDMKDGGTTIVDTATLAFAGADGRTEFTVDFVAQYVVTKPTTPVLSERRDTRVEGPSGVVDIVITQHPPNGSTIP